MTVSAIGEGCHANNNLIVMCSVSAGRVLETSLAKPPTEKRPLGLEPAYPPQRAGLLPQYQARAGYGYGADIYGGVGGYGPTRGYNQVRGVISSPSYRRSAVAALVVLCEN